MISPNEIRSTQFRISLKQLVVILALVILTYFCYAPGLSGGFLLDDFGTLKSLGDRGEIDSSSTAWIFISGGDAGPLGRPLSLLSFLIDARTWPTPPEPFKKTNILLHCLNGLLLFLTLHLLLRCTEKESSRCFWIACFATSLWMLNPFLVSTTLYIVQRMAMLSATFIILGILGYLVGRSLLPRRPRVAYPLMSLSVFGGTLLSALCKENGVLLPFLILVIEFSFSLCWKSGKPNWKWRALFLWLPSVFVLLYLSKSLQGFFDIIPMRGWSSFERLISQPSILLDYLYHLYIPRIETKGLLRDDVRIISPHFYAIPYTLILVGIIFVACHVRRKAPLITVALLFFLIGHLLESSVLPLELYFEHRNYVPSLMLFLPAAYGINFLKERSGIRTAFITAAIVIAIFAISTFLRTSLWSDNTKLYSVWAQKNPHSVRAQINYFQTIAMLGDHGEAIAVLETAMADNPESALLPILYAANQLSRSKLSEENFSTIARRLENLRYERRQETALKELIGVINRKPQFLSHADVMRAILLDWQRNWGSIPIVKKQAPYLQGLLESGQGNAGTARDFFIEALAGIDTVESGLNMTEILIQDEHYVEADEFLNHVEALLDQRPDYLFDPEGKWLKFGIEQMKKRISENLSAE